MSETLKKRASRAFGCAASKCKPFEINDPFQNNICIEGFRCIKEGKMGGSLYLVRVDGIMLEEPCLIYGTPSLAYPYTQSSWKSKNKRSDSLEDSNELPKTKTNRERLEEDEDEAVERDAMENATHNFEKEADLLAHSHKHLKYLSNFHPKAKKYYFSNKYNGTNILFWKYKDTEGKIKISAKTKGSATVTDTVYGAFLTLTYKALGITSGTALDPSSEFFPNILLPLLNPEYQSLCFELCGRLEPHLVDYSFEIALKPLFYTLNDGSIKPMISPHAINHIKCSEWLSVNNIDSIAYVDGFGPFEYVSAIDVVQQCKALQKMSYECNENFRKRLDLKLKYEYFHFATEGFVLYILDDKNRVVPDRTMYKIKPIDIEEVHWSRFDAQKEAQVIEAVQKMGLRDKEMNIQNLREELDIGDKEWGKFGVAIKKFIEKKHLFNIPVKNKKKKKKKNLE